MSTIYYKKRDRDWLRKVNTLISLSRFMALYGQRYYYGDEKSGVSNGLILSNEWVKSKRDLLFNNGENGKDWYLSHLENGLCFCPEDFAEFSKPVKCELLFENIVSAKTKDTLTVNELSLLQKGTFGVSVLCLTDLIDLLREGKISIKSFLRSFLITLLEYKEAGNGGDRNWFLADLLYLNENCFNDYLTGLPNELKEILKCVYQAISESLTNSSEPERKIKSLLKKYEIGLPSEISNVYPKSTISVTFGDYVSHMYGVKDSELSEVYSSQNKSNLSNSVNLSDFGNKDYRKVYEISTNKSDESFYFLEYIVNNYSELIRYGCSNFIPDSNNSLKRHANLWLSLDYYNDGMRFQKALDIDESLFKLKKASEMKLKGVNLMSYISKSDIRNAAIVGEDAINDYDTSGSILSYVKSSVLNEFYQKQKEEICLSNKSGNISKSVSKIWNMSTPQLDYMEKGLSFLVKSLKARGMSGVFNIEEKDDNISLSGNNFFIILYSNKNYKSQKKGYEDVEFALINSLLSILEGLPFSVKRITFNTEGIHEGIVRNSEVKGELEILLV